MERPQETGQDQRLPTSRSHLKRFLTPFPAQRLIRRRESDILTESASTHDLEKNRHVGYR